MFFITGVLVVPLILNFIVYSEGFPFVYGNGDTWLSFWGNYLGGILSAIVAYIVANSQIKKQLRLDMAKEQFNKRVNQLPALVRVKLEMEKYINELEETKKKREKYIKDNGGIRKKADEYDDFDEFLQSKREGIPEFEVTELHYYMESPEENVFSYIEKIEDIDLHVDLIHCFNFYRVFSEAINFNMKIADEQIRALDVEVEKSIGDGEFDKVHKLNNEKGAIRRVTNTFYAKKKSSWEALYEKDLINFFINVLDRLNKEIELVRKMKESGDLNEFKKVS